MKQSYLVFLFVGSVVFGQNIVVPDPNFKAFLVANCDTSGDGQISVTEAQAVTGFAPDNTTQGNLTGFLTYLPDWPEENWLLDMVDYLTNQEYEYVLNCGQPD